MATNRWMLVLFSALVALVCAAAAGCGDDDDDDDDDDDGGEVLITVSGNAFGFPAYELVEGATITVLEMPDRETTTDADGYWEFTDMPAGATASFVMDHPDYVPIQTKTFTLPEEDLERVTFQVPDQTTFDALALLVEVEIDPEKCQMVTTATIPGKSIYDEGAHGEEGATAWTTPELSDDLGPIYFNSNVYPDLTLTETSDDGGILWVNVPEGVYTIHGEKDGVEWVEPTMTCRAGYLVNASPPYGLQAVY